MMLHGLPQAVGGWRPLDGRSPPCSGRVETAICRAAIGETVILLTLSLHPY